MKGLGIAALRHNALSFSEETNFYHFVVIAGNGYLKDVARTSPKNVFPSLWCFDEPFFAAVFRCYSFFALPAFSFAIGGKKRAVFIRLSSCYWLEHCRPRGIFIFKNSLVICFVALGGICLGSSGFCCLPHHQQTLTTQCHWRWSVSTPSHCLHLYYRWCCILHQPFKAVSGIFSFSLFWYRLTYGLFKMFTGKV